ncbi:unnamed protein product [Somion occarium]|uniref:HMG box domain-containing protein n=1 Tax=Somion occarium TaxID=3059160 RepID=A0ABP1D270_9APHY
MANLPEGLAQFEYQKMQLIGSLSAVAETMRTCANIAEQFAQMVSQVSYAQGAPTNGQFAVPAVPLHAAPGRGKRKAADDTDGPKAKRVKKPRDPNAPKRPASSYLLFQNEVRQQLKDKNPTLPNNELLSLIAKMWKEMPKEQKDTYEARQKMAKEEWIVNKTAYQASMDAQEHTPSESPVAIQPAPVPVPVSVPAPAQAASDSSEDSSSEEEASDSDSDNSDKIVRPAKGRTVSKVPAQHPEKKVKKKA